MLELFLNCIEMRFMISLSSSSSLPLPQPLPFLSLPSPFVPPFFFLLPTLTIPFLPRLTFTLFSTFLFSLSLLFPLLSFLGSSAPQPISSLFFNQYLPIQTFHLFLHSFPFPPTSPTITTCYHSNFFLAKWKDSEMPELFYTPKCSHLAWFESPRLIQTPEFLHPVPSLCVYWLNVYRQFYFCVFFFYIIGCL